MPRADTEPIQVRQHRAGEPPLLTEANEVYVHDLTETPRSQLGTRNILLQN